MKLALITHVIILKVSAPGAEQEEQYIHDGNTS